MQVRRKKNETELVGAIRACSKGVTSHNRFIWGSRVLAKERRDVISPYAFQQRE